MLLQFYNKFVTFGVRNDRSWGNIDAFLIEFISVAIDWLTWDVKRTIFDQFAIRGEV